MYFSSSAPGPRALVDKAKKLVNRARHLFQSRMPRGAFLSHNPGQDSRGMSLYPFWPRPNGYDAAALP